jgi:hypothetical protein
MMELHADRVVIYFADSTHWNFSNSVPVFNLPASRLFNKQANKQTNRYVSKEACGCAVKVNLIK